MQKTELSLLSALLEEALAVIAVPTCWITPPDPSSQFKELDWVATTYIVGCIKKDKSKTFIFLSSLLVYTELQIVSH